MSDEPQAASQEPAATDLDSIISGAIDQHTTNEAPAPAAETESAEPSEPRPDATGRLHGQDGKFVAKPKEESAEPAASEPEPVVESVAPPVTPTAEPALQPIEPPARLTPEDKAVFAKMAREHQETVARWYKGFEGDYTRKTQEAADLRRSAEPILNAVKPFEQYLTQIQPMVRQTPAEMIGSLLGVEYQLRTGDPLQKAQALHQIAQSYGIDLASIARGEIPAAPDPAFHQLRQSFGNLEQQVSQITSWFQQEQDRQTQREIAAFKDAADTSGRPLHPHFERVKGVMGQLIRDDPSLTLEASYQKAIEPIQQAIAEELKNREAEAEKQRNAALEKAKKAAPVKSSGSQPNGSAKAKDLDSILSGAIDAHIA